VPRLPALTDLLIDGLATYRLQRLVTTDQITAPLRDRIFNRYPDTSTALSLSYLISCPHCTSVHAAAAVIVMRTAPLPAPLQYLARFTRLILATSAITSLLHDTGLVKAEPTHDPADADADDPF